MKKLLFTIIALCIGLFTQIQADMAIQIRSQKKVEPNKTDYYTLTLNFPEIKSALSTKVDQHFNAYAANLVNQVVKKFVTDAKEGMQWFLQRKQQGHALPFPLSEKNNVLQITYRIFYAKNGIVSLRFQKYTYFYGSAHPNTQSFTINYDLVQDKPLALADLFQPNSGYLKKISDYCRVQITAKLYGKQTTGSANNPQLEILAKGTEPVLSNFTSWNITSKNLLINFDPYAVAAYAEGPQYVFIPYTLLMPLLIPNGPISRVIQ